MLQVALELVHEQAERAVPRVEPDGIVHVLPHRMRPSVITNRAAWLLIAGEDPVRAAERLDEALVLQHLVEVERVDPFGVEARQHLVHDDEDVELLLRVPLDSHIWLLVREPRGHVPLECGVSGNGIVLARVELRVALEYLVKALLLEDRAGGVVGVVVADVGVEERGHLEMRGFVAEHTIVRDGLGDARGGKDCVELPAARERRPSLDDVLEDHPEVVAGDSAGAAVAVRATVLALWHVVLYALRPGTIGLPVTSHGDLRGVHVPEVGLSLLWVREGIGLTVRARLLQGNLTPDVTVLVRADHVGVEG